MTKDNLVIELCADRVEQSELESVLSAHFGGAVWAGGDEIAYPGNTEQYALKLCYRDGVLDRILPGPLFRPEQIAELRAKLETLLRPTEEKVGSFIFFAAVPVAGCFRYRDWFQFRPAPNDAPRPPDLLGDHPFLVEFKFRPVGDVMIDAARRSQVTREIELLSAVLVRDFGRSIGARARWHWVLSSTAPLRSQYLQEMYAMDGAPHVQDAFTPLNGCEPMGREAAQAYYNARGVGFGATLALPDNLEAQIDRYCALSTRTREQFLRACFWFRHSFAVFHYSRSAAFTALISAVEALIPSVSSPRCQTCGMQIGPGPTQRFADFVEEFSGASPAADDRRRFYGIRSALSHGGTLLHSDRDAWSGFSIKPLQQDTDIRSVWQLVRVVLLNWLQRAP